MAATVHTANTSRRPPQTKGTGRVHCIPTSDSPRPRSGAGGASSGATPIVNAALIHIHTNSKFPPKVLRILVQLLHLGECDENVMWDDFLWILLRFCTLNRCELSQVLFHIIQNELGTPQRLSVIGVRTWWSSIDVGDGRELRVKRQTSLYCSLARALPLSRFRALPYT